MNKRSGECIGRKGLGHVFASSHKEIYDGIEKTVSSCQAAAMTSLAFFI